ncbi:MAG: class I adenylate-forming enzyme family protein [Magnetospiraceae bacterium]
MAYAPVFGIATVADLFETHAALRPHAVAFIEFDGKDHAAQLTYAEGKQIVDGIATRLVSAGVKPGDRVAVRLPKSARNMLLFFAVSRVGGIYVPINPEFTDREAGVLIEDADPSILVDNREGDVERTGDATWKRFRFDTGGADDLMTLPAGDLPAKPAADQGALMLFTSGTTGRPKGAMLTHENLLSNVAALSDAWGITDADRLLHVLPVYHGHGLYLGVVMPLLRRAGRFRRQAPVLHGNTHRGWRWRRPPRRRSRAGAGARHVNHRRILAPSRQKG